MTILHTNAADSVDSEIVRCMPYTCADFVSSSKCYSFLVFYKPPTEPARQSLLDSTTLTILCKPYKSLSSSLCTNLIYSFTSSVFLGTNIILGTLFSNTRNLSFSLKICDHVSHPLAKLFCIS